MRTPRALAARVGFPLVVIAALIASSISVGPTRAQAPTEGTVRLIPAMSDAPGEAGPFTVFIIGQDLHHSGVIAYDDNRDGTPDRSVPSDGVAAFQFTVDYNPAVLAVGTVESGPELSRTGRTFQCLAPDKKPGSVSFACLSAGDAPPGVTGTLTLASVELVPQASGFSPLALSAELSGPLGDSVNIAVNGGVARVSGTVLAPVPTETEPAGPPLLAGSSTPGDVSSTLQPAGQSGTATGQAATTQTAAKVTTPARTAGTPTSASHVSSGRSGDSGGLSGATLWSLIVAGSVGAGGLVMLGAMVWRQRQHRSHV